MSSSQTVIPLVPPFDADAHALTFNGMLKPEFIMSATPTPTQARLYNKLHEIIDEFVNNKGTSVIWNTETKERVEVPITDRSILIVPIRYSDPTDEAAVFAIKQPHGLHLTNTSLGGGFPNSQLLLFERPGVTHHVQGIDLTEEGK